MPHRLADLSTRQYPLACRFVSDMTQRGRIVGCLQRAAIGLLHGMAMHATIAREQAVAFIQLRCSSEWRAMALSARGFNVARRQNGLLPRQRAAVCLFYGRCRALATMANDTTHLFGAMRNHRMPAEWLSTDVDQTGFFLADVTRSAPINHAQLRKPYLLDAALEVALQSHGFSTAANQSHIAFLIMTPLAEAVLSGRNRQRDQKQ